MNKSFTLFYASDKRGIEPLGVAIFSLLENAAESTTYRIFILSKDFTPEDRQRISGIAHGNAARHSIQFKDISNLKAFDDLSWSRISIMTWSRIFIAELFPEEKGIILYLDIDTLVCSDLTDLFETPLNGKAVGVVLERSSAPNSHFNDRLGIPLESPGYFNAGVMLIDLDAFREQNLKERVLQFTKENLSAIKAHDQDPLNAVLHDNLQQIHPRWNWQDSLTRRILNRTSKDQMNRGNSLELSVDAALRPGILHFVGPHKPWYYNYRIEGKRYEKVLARSGFGQYPLPGKTFKKWVKALLYKPMFWFTWKRIKFFDKHFRSLGA